LPASLIGCLETMIDFLLGVMRPDGLMPQVGDADDGRLHILSAYGSWRPQDARHLFGPAARMFDNRDWMRAADEWGMWESEWWGLDPSTPKSPEAPAVPERDGVRHFPSAGLTAFRHHGSYLLITNGVVGTAGFGNHKHNDLLGFEYHHQGDAIIVDPGSYVYTPDPDARNLFRSTVFHNTVSVDGQEQNEIRPEWLFRMFERATPEHLQVRELDDTLVYRGRHSGYARLREPLVHERTFTLRRSDGSLVISDVLEGRGTHQLRWHFHFAPGVSIAMAAPGVLDVRAPRIPLQMTLPAGLSPAIGSGWYSSSYGVRVSCMVLDLEAVESIEGRREYGFQLTRR
jgi:hypothetical protein